MLDKIRARQPRSSFADFKSPAGQFVHVFKHVAMGSGPGNGLLPGSLHVVDMRLQYESHVSPPAGGFGSVSLLHA